MDYRFKKSQYVELMVTGGTGSSQIQFQPQTYLQGRRTLSLETYTANDITTSKFNIPVVTIAQLKTCFLTLYCNDVTLGVQQVPDGSWTGQAFGEWFKDIPLWDLHRVANATAGSIDPYVRDIFLTDERLIITWEKSFVYTTNPALFSSNVSFLFNVGYE